MMYQTVRQITGYLLESGEIGLDRTGCFVWIHNPKLFAVSWPRRSPHPVGPSAAIPAQPPPMTIEIYTAAERLAEYEALRGSTRSEDRRVVAVLKKATGVLKENPYTGNRIHCW